MVVMCLFYNLTTQETETERLHIWGLLGLHNETLSQKQQKNESRTVFMKLENVTVIISEKDNM